MEEKILISVLIPIYNAEKTIARCLDSICQQSPQKCEIILINDGSSDNSEIIVSEYAKRYPYIHLFTQQNSGVAKTRQSLLEKASGEYVLFCDSDDFVEPEAINIVIDSIEKNTADIFFFGYNLIREIGNKQVLKRNFKSGIYVYDDVAPTYLAGLSDLYWSALWNKCYKKSLIDNPEIITFPELMEDVVFNVVYFSRVSNICIVNKAIYNYVQIGESLTRGNREDSSKAIYSAYDTYLCLHRIITQLHPIYYHSSDFDVYTLLCNARCRAKTIDDLKLVKEISNSDIFITLKKHIRSHYTFFFVKRRFKKIIRSALSKIIRLFN